MTSPRARDLLALAAICALGFALRALVIANTTGVGVFADMQDYHDRGVHLLQTGTLSRDAFRVPAFPMLIAGVFKLFGQQLVAVRLAQAVLGVLTVALTYVLARRLTTGRGALVAAFIVAVYPALVLYSFYLMAETLFTFLIVLAIVLWMNSRTWVALVAGLVLGAATLTRSVGLALLAGIVLAEAWRMVAERRRPDLRPLARVALLIAGFAIALAPWVQRNYAVYHRFVPTDTSSGFNALLGNYPGATGRHPGIPAVEAAAQTYWRDARNDVERSDLGMKVAREFVRENPMRAARLAILKVGYLFGLEGREHAWGYSHHYQGRRDARTVWAWGIAIIISFPLLMIAASVGLWRPGLAANPAGVLIVTTLLSVVALHIASFGDSRFHLPWIPLLAVLAARAVAPLERRSWTWARRVGLALWLLAFALIWRSQAPELLDVLPRLAESPAPLILPY